MESTNPKPVGPIAVSAGAAVAGERIIALAPADSAPVQRAMRRAAEQGLLIDLTYGRRVRCALFMDSGHVVRLALRPERFLARWSGQGNTVVEER